MYSSPISLRAAVEYAINRWRSVERLWRTASAARPFAGIQFDEINLVGVAIFEVQANRLEEGVAVGGQFVGVARIVAGHTAAPGGRIVEEVTPMKTVGVAGQGGEELRRVAIIAPMEQEAMAGHPAVEAAGQHLEWPDQADAECFAQSVERIERGKAVDELPEAIEVVGEVEAVFGSESSAALFEARGHDFVPWATPLGGSRPHRPCKSVERMILSYQGGKAIR